MSPDEIKTQLYVQ